MKPSHFCKGMRIQTRKGWFTVIQIWIKAGEQYKITLRGEDNKIYEMIDAPTLMQNVLDFN